MNPLFPPDAKFREKRVLEDICLKFLWPAEIFLSSTDILLDQTVNINTIDARLSESQ